MDMLNSIFPLQANFGFSTIRQRKENKTIDKTKECILI